MGLRSALLEPAMKSTMKLPILRQLNRHLIWRVVPFASGTRPKARIARAPMVGQLFPRVPESERRLCLVNNEAWATSCKSSANTGT